MAHRKDDEEILKSSRETDIFMSKYGLDINETDLDVVDDENEKVEDDKLRSIRVRGYYRLAKIYYDKADLNLAESYFKKTLDLWEPPKDTFFVLKVLGFLVRISSEKLDANETTQHITNAENFISNIPKWFSKLPPEYYYNLGLIKTYQGNFFESKNYFKKALKHSREENQKELTAKLIYSLALTNYNLKEWEKGLKYLDELEDILHVLNKSYLFGTLHLLYGHIYSELGSFHKAIIHYRKAKRALHDKTCWNLNGYILLSEGIIYKRIGEFNKASFYLNFALNSIDASVFKKLGNLLKNEINTVNDSNVDILIDKANRIIYERRLGPIDFKHRFVLLEILYLLASNPGTYYDKEDLARAIWKDEYNPLIHDKLIYTSVSRLRKLVEPKKYKRKYIIRGKDGYTFNPKGKVRFHKDEELDKNFTFHNIELSAPV